VIVDILNCIKMFSVYIIVYIIFFYVTGAGISPFGRYPSTFGAPNPNFPNLSTFPPREIPLGGLAVHPDPWRGYIKY